jgi:lambda family phage portal protein
MSAQRAAASSGLVTSSGAPIPSRAIAQIRQRAGANRGGMRASLTGSAPNFLPYDAANWSSQEFGDWLPWILSPDREINLYRDRIVARARDLVRNDGWAKGAIGRILDATVGSDYRLVAKPDYRNLGLYDKAFDAVWAAEFRSAVEARWRSYSQDVAFYSDVSRQLTMSQQFRLALGHKLIDGESLMLSYWLPDRVGDGGARYATAFLGVDPDRLSNPNQGPDTKYMRGGVEIDDHNVPIAYHIRKAEQNDWYASVESVEWERVVREDSDGYRRVFHDFDRDRFAQNRGMSVFAPVLGRLKMLAKYYGVELSAATVASAFGLYTTTPFDVDMIRNALDSDGDDATMQDGLGWYQDMLSDFHQDRNLQVNGVKIAALAPGEDLKTVAPVRPNSGFSPFTHEMLRGVGQCLGISAEEAHNDYGESSWSSARAGIVKSEMTYLRRLRDFDINTANPIYSTWLGENFELGELPLPRNAPSWGEARTAYSRCRWLGTPRGWVDPVAERQGEVLGLDAGFSTLEAVCAKQGSDWEENLDQRALELNRMKELGIPRPEWAGVDMTATEVSKKPEAT